MNKFTTVREHSPAVYILDIHAEWGSRTLKEVCYRAFPGSAMCVQNLDDSRGLAIRITYRISLRSSSLWEPRHPLLKVVQTSIFILFHGNKPSIAHTTSMIYYRLRCTEPRICPIWLQVLWSTLVSLVFGASSFVV